MAVFGGLTMTIVVTCRAMPRALLDLSLGFRNAYLDHDRVTAQLRAWTEAFPAICRMTSIAKTPEGRDVWLLAVGRDLDRIRPAVWVDGNIHAAELAGVRERAREAHAWRSSA